MCLLTIVWSTIPHIYEGMRTFHTVDTGVRYLTPRPPGHHRTKKCYTYNIHCEHFSIRNDATVKVFIVAEVSDREFSQSE